MLVKVDTTAKRLMSNQGKVTSASQLNSVVFRDTANAALGKRMLSLFPGLGYAASYKVCMLTSLGVRILLTLWLDPTTSLQVRWSAVCTRLPCAEPWRFVQQDIWKGKWKGNDACLCWKVRLDLLPGKNICR